MSPAEYIPESQDLAFEIAEYEVRLAATRERVRAAGHVALIVTVPENICYLSGHWTPGYHAFQALVVPADGEPFLLLRTIEWGSVREFSWIQHGYVITDLENAIPTLAEALEKEGITSGSLAVELDSSRHETIVTGPITDRLPGLRIHYVSNTVEASRARKTSAEVRYMRHSVELAERALCAGIAALSEDDTDSDVAGRVAGALTAGGSEFTGSPSYVVAGPASARTHAVHARRPVKRDEHLWLEISGSTRRYHGVTARVGALEPTQKLVDVFSASRDALNAMLSASGAGVPAREVDHAGRSIVAAAGFAEMWTNYRSAYSLGLSFPPGLGEPHFLSIQKDDDLVLESGMVFHYIPIIKIPGFGIVGCTATALVTDEGSEIFGTLEQAPITPKIASQHLQRIDSPH